MRLPCAAGSIQKLPSPPAPLPARAANHANHAAARVPMVPRAGEGSKPRSPGDLAAAPLRAACAHGRGRAALSEQKENSQVVAAEVNCAAALGGLPRRAAIPALGGKFFRGFSIAAKRCGHGTCDDSAGPRLAAEEKSPRGS